ncbi:MAG TPA: P-loop NTPase fold protein [Puia sp.]|nr:P-loop NTPase fold protein [Puia sp.]
MLKIILDLKNSSDAHEFSAKTIDSTELVHKKEFDAITNWINQRLHVLAEKKNQGRSHDTFTIYGTRGSGKTSFLLSLIENYKESEIALLKIIDPTLIEDKGHVFLHIISLIKDAVDRKLDKDSCNPKDSNYQRKVGWLEQVKSLAHGLPSIDGVGGELTDVSWQDPEFIMEKGIRSVTSAIKLEENFKKVVSQALSILEKKAFLIVFDDIDINFKKGWPVLETIRKYFTSPELVTLLSGDLRLYSIGIKRHQWENFGDKLLKYEVEKQNKFAYYSELVTEAEGQYLQKVLKPERRIHLTTLYQKTRLPDYVSSTNIANDPSGDTFSICVTIENNPIEIKQRYITILKAYGIVDSYQAEAYHSFLLDLPLRTQIRFLSHYEKLVVDISGIRVSDSFLSDLYEKQIDVNLIGSNPRFLNIVVLDLLVRERMLDESYQLQPTTTDASLNSTLVALSLEFSRESANDPYIIFDYFIKIGYTRNLLSFLGYRPEKEKTDDSQTSVSIEGLRKHSNMQKDKVLRDIAGLASAYMIAYFKIDNANTKPSAGIIELKGLAGLAKKGGTEDRIDRAFESRNSIEQTLAFLPLSICKSPKRQSTIVVYSIYTLLGTIGELIRRENEGDADKGLLELSQPRSYAMPDLQKSNFSTNESMDDSILDTGKEQPPNENMSSDIHKYLKQWIDRFSKMVVSPHLLGKIITRTFYAHQNIETSEQTESLSLANAMHARVIAFMNAVLIEDAKENITKVDGLNINNTNHSDSTFVGNLQKMTIHKQNLVFSKWILSCPLLLCYLEKESKLIKAISDFCEFGDQVLYTESIYLLLAKVGVKGSRNSPKTEDNIYDYINQLKQYDYSLFKESPNRNVTRSNNKAIDETLPGNLLRFLTTGGQKRALRKYLAQNRISW